MWRGKETCYVFRNERNFLGGDRRERSYEQNVNKLFPENDLKIYEQIVNKLCRDSCVVVNKKILKIPNGFTICS